MLALALAAYLASLAYLASWLLHILPLAYSCLVFVLPGICLAGLDL